MALARGYAMARHRLALVFYIVISICKKVVKQSNFVRGYCVVVQLGIAQPESQSDPLQATPTLPLQLRERHIQ